MAVATPLLDQPEQLVMRKLWHWIRRRCSYEGQMAIVHEKLHEGVLRMLDGVPKGTISEKGVTYTTGFQCPQCEGTGVLLYAEQDNECLYCGGTGVVENT